MRVALLALILGCGGRDPDTDAPTDTQTTTGSTTSGPPGFPVWTERFQDDVWTDGADQHHPTHARADDGSSLVLWDQHVGDETHVMARAYDPDHTPLGNPVMIGLNGSTMARPDADALPDGRYAAIWHTRFDVFTRTVAHNGTAQGTELLVNNIRGVDPDKGQPDLAVLADGSFVTVYHFSDPTSDPVGTYWMRRFDADLNELSIEEPVASSPQVGSPPDVDALPDGGWVIGWSTRTDVAGELYLSWFDASGTQLHSVRVDETPADLTPSRPNVATQPNGTVAVTWRVQTNEGDGLGVYGRVYGADREPLSDPFELQPDSQRPSVAAGPGVFLFTWEPPNSNRIKARAYDARNGEPLEDPWEPFGGNDDQHRPQASFTQTSTGIWEVLFTADRGPNGNRNLARSVWELQLVEETTPATR